jgi:hypothetical protein
MSTTPIPIQQDAAPTPDVASNPMPAPNAVPAPDSVGPVNPMVPPNPPGNMAPPSMTPDQPAVAPTAPPPPHAKLLAMVQGLSIGLGAAATSIATHGREGGSAQVIQQYGELQRQKQEAASAASAQKSAKLQQQLAQAEYTHTNTLNIMLAANMKNDMALSDMAVAESKTKLAGEQQTQAITGADFQATHGGMKPDEFSKALASTNPVSGQSGTSSSFFTIGAQQTLQAAKTSGLDDSDPFVKKLQTVLADPNSTAKDLWLANDQLQNQRKLQHEATAEATARHAADPLYKLETDPSEMTGDKAPAAMATLSSKLADPSLPPGQKPRVQRLLSMATKAQDNALAFDAAKERAKQTITDGDPKAAGALLQSGLVSPQELISSRKPQFAQQAFDEAIRLGGGVKDPKTGKWTGGTWSAVKAESQYEYAKNPRTHNTLNLLTTMQAPGGSIDIAQKMFTAIPGKIDEKTFNKIITGAITEFGGQSTVNFQAAMVSLADEYAQVLQGGAATETTLSQAKDLIQKSYTKTQGAGAFDTIRLDMAARQKGMIRDNPALMQMYSDKSVVPVSGKAVSLKSAMALPVNQGKTEEQVRADIASHGHQVGE